MAKAKKSSRAKGRAAAKAPRRSGRHFVTNIETGITHQVTAEQAAYLTRQHDPVSGRQLYREGQGGDAEPIVAQVTEAAYGVPDDALLQDAIAMAERGGQPKGTVAGPTIPQEGRTDRAGRVATTNPLAKGEAASKTLKAPAGAVRQEVAARHRAGMNLPEEAPSGPSAEEQAEEAAERLNEQAED